MEVNTRLLYEYAALCCRPTEHNPRCSARVVLVPLLGKSGIGKLFGSCNTHSSKQSVKPSQFIQGAYCNLRNKSEAYPLNCCVVKNGVTENPWQDSDKKRNADTIQDARLVELKAAIPCHKSIDSDVLQRNIARLNTTYKNFFDGRGFPAFKNCSNFKKL